MEIVVKAKTVDEAVALGAEKLGKTVEQVKYTVLEEGKKGFLGMFSTEAQVKVYYDEEQKAETVDMPDLTLKSDERLGEDSPKDAKNPNGKESPADADSAAELPPVQEKVVEFLNTIIADMGVQAQAQVTAIDERLSENSKTYEKDIHIEITGKGLGMLIGRHGDVLDSLQYLANIVVGRYPKRSEKHEYVRIVLDIENYRLKREETLKALARRMASKVLSTGRNFTLEPMSSYERRIIHSEVQQIKGVHTFSVGTENNRRVVIAYGEAVDEDAQ